MSNELSVNVKGRDGIDFMYLTFSCLVTSEGVTLEDVGCVNGCQNVAFVRFGSWEPTTHD
jgi:hypothetical protein